MSFIPFGEWLPDLPDVATPGLTEAKNVIATDASYRPLNSHVGRGDALAARCQGAYTASLATGDTLVYAGTAGALYKRVGSGWTDVSDAGGYTTPTGEYWGMVQYNDKIVATNFSEVMQIDDVGGTGFADISGAPNAKRVGVIRNFVFAGDVDYGAFGHVPHAVQWCAIDDPTDWPIPFTDDAASKQSSREELDASYGPVTHIADGESFGLVFQQRAVTRFTYVGGAVVFQVQTFERGRGAYAPEACVQIGNMTYFLALDGFYATDGFQVQPIGHNKVDTWFQQTMDFSFVNRITAGVDFEKNIIVWSFPGKDAVNGVANKLLIYNYRDNRWTYGEQALEFVFGGRSPGYTLDEIDGVGDLDELGISFDSAAWTGGYVVLQAFDTSHFLGEFAGPAKTAVIETAEVPLNAPGRAFVKMVKPIVESGGNITVQLGTRDDTSEDVSWGTATSLHPRSKQAHFRSDAYYHRARVTLADGFDSATGIHYTHEASGEV